MALVVLVVSMVVMTMGLAMSKSTVVETKIDKDQELLKQAFNTAESGIDYYLSTGKTEYKSPDNKSKADIEVKPLGGGNKLDFGYTPVGNLSYFWLVGHNSDDTIDMATRFGGGDLSICVENGFSDAALKVDYFYTDDSGIYQVQRKIINFGSGVTNGETADPSWGNCNGGGKKVAWTLTGSPLLLVVTPLKMGSQIYLESSTNTFPVQGSQISSVGKIE